MSRVGTPRTLLLVAFNRYFSRKVSIMRKNVDSLLERQSVRVQDKNAVAVKLERMIADGAERLQVITDFDYTITKYRTSKGDVGLLTHGVLANRLNESQKTKLQTLCDKYAPIEGGNMTIEAKTPYMVDWWKQSHDLITELGFQECMLDEFVRCEPKLELRSNSMDFLRHSEHAGIPVLIFSGGIGDIINVLLRQQLGHMPSNVHTVSNFIRFDDKGRISGFRDPLIHTFNKNATVVQRDHSFFEQLKSRPNVFLVGDSLGDLHMDIGIVNEANVLKVGFFNREVTQASLAPYLSGFDLVLVNDQTFDVPLAILQSIIGSA